MQQTLETAARDEAEEQKDNRRPLSGTMVRPKQQLKYAMILVCGGVIAQSVVVGWVVYFLHSTIALITTTYNLDPAVGNAITQAITNSLALVMLVATAVALVAILVGIKLSHRIYGPMIPFQRHINELKSGNYSSRIRLRQNDDMTEIRDSLNDLAITLEDRYKR